MVRDGTSHNHERAVHCTLRVAHTMTHTISVTRHPAKLPSRVASERQGHVANVNSQISGSICLILRPRAQTHPTQALFYIRRGGWRVHGVVLRFTAEHPNSQARGGGGGRPPPKGV